MSKTAQPRGFTLIELMISIAIVSVMFAVIINSVSGIRQNSRNAQRQADLRSIQSALQNFYADQNYFPPAASTAYTDLTTLTSLTNCSNTSSCTTTTTYLAIIPTDPTGTNPYKYQPRRDPTATTTCTTSSGYNLCHYYILCASLEGTSPQTGTQYSQCSNATNGFGTSYNYQINP